VAAQEQDVADATRRTRLANERTYLAWLRSGLTTLAVAVGAGKIVPELTDAARWPSVVLGAAYGVLGIALLVLGQRRFVLVEAALARGEFVALSRRQSSVLAGAGVALALLTLAFIVVDW
jgi:putative membrane protein